MISKNIKTDAVKKNPSFIRQDSHKKKKLGKKWRRPKGLHSKMRLQKKGYRVIVKPGYGKPNKEKKLLKGLQAVVIHNVKELEVIDEKKQGIIISSKVGNRKKVEIMNQAEKRKIEILNIKSIKEYLDLLKQKFEKRKEEKEEKKKKKEQKRKEKPKKDKKKEEKKTEQTDEEEKKKIEKKEKDKILTKKE